MTRKTTPESRTPDITFIIVDHEGRTDRRQFKGEYETPQDLNRALRDIVRTHGMYCCKVYVRAVHKPTGLAYDFGKVEVYDDFTGCDILERADQYFTYMRSDEAVKMIFGRTPEERADKLAESRAAIDTWEPRFFPPAGVQTESQDIEGDFVTVKDGNLLIYSEKGVTYSVHLLDISALPSEVKAQLQDVVTSSNWSSSLDCWPEAGLTPQPGFNTPAAYLVTRLGLASSEEDQELRDLRSQLLDIKGALTASPRHSARGAFFQLVKEHFPDVLNDIFY